MTERRYHHNLATPTPYEMVRTGDRWHRDPAGASTTGLYGKPPSSPGAVLWITEGQSDADALIRLGEYAVTPGSSSNWAPHLADWVCEQNPYHVIVCEDNDAPGRRFVGNVIDSLANAVPHLDVVTFRDLPEKADTRDAIEAGAKLAQIKSKARPWDAWEDVEEQQQEGRTDWERYGIVSKAVLESGLNVYAKVLYVHLDREQGKDGRPAEGWRNVAEQLDISENACRRGIAELVEAGLVRVKDVPSLNGTGSARTVFYVLHHLQRGRVNPLGVSLPPKRLKGRTTRPPPRLREMEAPPSEGCGLETGLHPERVVIPESLHPERGQPLGMKVGGEIGTPLHDPVTGELIDDVRDDTLTQEIEEFLRNLGGGEHDHQTPHHDNQEVHRTTQAVP